MYVGHLDVFFNNFHAKLHCVCCVFVFMKESPNFIVNNIEKKKLEK